MKILAGIVGIMTIVLGLFLWHSIMVFVNVPANLMFLFWTYCVSVIVFFILTVAAGLNE